MSWVASPVAASQTSDATSWQFGFNADIRAGRFLVACIAVDAPSGTLPTLTLSDTRGNVWVPAASVVSGTTVATFLVACYVDQALSAAQDLLTITSDSTRSRVVVIVDEFDDNIVTAVADQTATDAGIPPLSSGTTGTTTSANELVVATFAFATANVFTADPPYSDNITQASGADTGNIAVADAFRTVTTTGTQEATGTLVNFSAYAAAIATFPIMETLPGVSYDIAIDWQSDGDFTDAGDNISDRVLSRGGIQLQYGRDQARSLAPAQAGGAAFEVDNRSRDYSPDNSSGPLFGLLGPGRPVRIRARFNDELYSLFSGQIDTYDVIPDPVTESVMFTALDLLGRMRAADASTELHEAIRTGDAINLLLDDIGWPSDQRIIDPGATTIQWWWVEDTDCFTAAEEIVASEGPGAIFSVDPNGNAVFQDRHHRILAPESVNVQATFNASGTEPLFSAPLIYDVGWRDVINRVEFSIDERRPSGRRVTVWEADPAPFTIVSGETRELIAQASDPFFGALTPESGVDFTLSGTVAVTLSRTSGQSTIISFTASGGPAEISDLKLRAFSVDVARVRQVTAQDQTSIDTDGIRSFPDTAPFAGVQDSAAIASLIVAQRAQRLPTVTFRLANANDTRIIQQLTRNLSDRIHITEPTSDIDRDFYLEQIQHEITEGGKFHSTTFGSEATPVVAEDVLILDVGELDVDTLGSSAFDDPARVFIFDDSSQGRFDVGLFGT